MKINTLKKRAEKFRADHGIKNPNGVVFFYKNKAVCWSAELGNADRWEPSVLALTASGQLLISVGGNAQYGAKQWQLAAQ